MTGDQAPEVLQPGEQSLDLPAPLVAPEHPPVLGHPFPAAQVGCDQLDPALLAQPLVQRVAVVCPVPDQTRGLLLEEALVERRLDERDLMRRSTRNPTGDRKTSAVCNCHDLGPLPALGFSDGRAPFLAPAKVPSMNASLMSIF